MTEAHMCKQSAPKSMVDGTHISKVYMKIATVALIDQSQAALHDDALLPARSPADCSQAAGHVVLF